MGPYLVSIWLLGGAIALILRYPSGARASRGWSIALGLFMLGILSGALSLLLLEPMSSAFVWIALALVNLALVTVGWRSTAKILASLGALTTIAALFLIAGRSFVSLPMIVAAGVLSLAAALLAGPLTRVPRNA